MLATLALTYAIGAIGYGTLTALDLKDTDISVRFDDPEMNEEFQKHQDLFIVIFQVSVVLQAAIFWFIFAPLKAIASLRSQDK